MGVELNGIRLHYRLDGEPGAPWLTFGNSLFTNLSLWDEQVDALQDSFHILRYDQRGHGRSAATAGPYTLELLANDLAALLDHLGIARTHYVGISMGGNAALSIGLRHRDRFD